MDKTFHQTAPLLALDLMPKEFKNFMLTNSYTIENIKIDADLPDLVDKDNIENDAIIRHSHSFKMDLINDELKPIDGDLLERLIGLCADAHDFYKEGKHDMVRYCLSKMTHYRIDALTFPHLFHGRPWSQYHEHFETEMGKFIEKNKNLLVDIKFEELEDIERDIIKTAQEQWFIGKDVVRKLEEKEKLTGNEKLEICKKCIKAIGDLWLTLAKNIKII